MTARGIVWASERSMSTRAKKSSLQTQLTLMMAMLAMALRETGSTTRQKTPKREQPSICAASSISTGKLRK